jgi:hypothetical protein
MINEITGGVALAKGVAGLHKHLQMLRRLKVRVKGDIDNHVQSRR